MAEAPTTLEGWYTLHDVYAVDWPRWNDLSRADQASISTEASGVLAALGQPGDGHSAVYSLLSQKGDLCLVHWRRTLEELRRAELVWAQTRLRSFLTPSYSYLAVIELGGYELSQHAAAMVARAGTKPGDAGYQAAVQAEMEKVAKPRLFPAVPDKRYCCFYPMSKRRGEHVNWYDLSTEERAAFMKGHGEIGRKYTGKVVQVIQGSVGFDDWEWGVTLFADDPLVFKKLIYEMRFDPASSRFALFGPFYVGIHFAPSDLDEVLAHGLVR